MSEDIELAHLDMRVMLFLKQHFKSLKCHPRRRRLTFIVAKCCPILKQEGND
jgi:hypothetical protein